MAFAFCATTHEYLDEDRGEVLPHITSLLEAAGLTDERWYSEESCERGSRVHRMSADWDLGAITNPDVIVSMWKGWLLAHVAAMKAIPHEWWHIEEPWVHAWHRFGGRLDRVGIVYGAVSVVEIKSGPFTKAHPIQTALQAILASPVVRLPPEAIVRYGLYEKANGKWKLEEFKETRKDLAEANRILRRYCRMAA